MTIASLTVTPTIYAVETATKGIPVVGELEVSKPIGNASANTIDEFLRNLVWHEVPKQATKKAGDNIDEIASMSGCKDNIELGRLRGPNNSSPEKYEVIDNHVAVGTYESTDPGLLAKIEDKCGFSPIIHILSPLK